MKQEQIEAYEAMVASRIAPGELLVAETTPRKMDILHATMGLVGELLELLEPQSQENMDIEHAVEEAGDSLFYVVNLHRVVGIPMKWNYTPPYTMVEMFNPAGVIKLASDILDCGKRLGIYGSDKKEHEDALILCAERSVDFIFGIRWFLRVPEADRERFTLESLARANTIKLDKRFHNSGYSKKSALGRADKNGES